MKKLSLQGWRARPKSTIAVYPSVYTVAYATGFECLKIYGAKLNSVVYVIGKDDMEIFMEPKSDYQKFSARLVKKFKKQPKYLDGLIKWSEGQINLLYDFIDKNLGKDVIKTLTNKELADNYLEYVNKYLAYHLKNTPAWWIGALAAEEELRKYLIANYPDKNTDNLLSAIIDPSEYLSENFKEELSLLNIAIRIKKDGHVNLRSIDDMSLAVRKTFNEHCLAYSSLPFGYKTGLVWQRQDFLKRLRQLIKKNPAILKINKLKEVRARKNKRDKLMADLNLPKDFKNLVVALRKLSYLQELKKTTQVKSHPILQLIVKKEIARRLNIEAKYIDYLSETEIAALLKVGFITPKFKRDLIQRESFSVNIIKNMKPKWLIGKEAKEFIKNNNLTLNISGIKEIKGQVASKGLVRGHVKICLTSTEINKIKNGDILVTAMTTPDFVPAMRRAAAIITDEGGITSHAAIVARELNKPCIIGAKIATKILHDGDLVEVDANKGIIRKIS